MVMGLFKKLAGIVLPKIIDLLSPAIRDELKGLLVSLHKKALATENPFDDYGVEFIAELLAIELPK